MTQAKLKIKKGDQVVVISGADKGAKGEVTAVMPEQNKAIVQGVKLVKKHNKPSQASAGGIVTKEAPIHISNLALVDPKSGEATRVKYNVLKDGTKVRVATKSGETLD